MFKRTEIVNTWRLLNASSCVLQCMNAWYYINIVAFSPSKKVSMEI